jgi:hypothetical protein
MPGYKGKGRQGRRDSGSEALAEARGESVPEETVEAIRDRAVTQDKPGGAGKGQLKAWANQGAGIHEKKGKESRRQSAQRMNCPFGHPTEHNQGEQDGSSGCRIRKTNGDHVGPNPSPGKDQTEGVGSSWKPKEDKEDAGHYPHVKSRDGQ